MTWHGPTHVHDLLDQAAERFGARVAVADADREVTYTELRDASLAAVSNLVAGGVRPGSRVFVRHQNSIDVCAIMYALSRIGAVFVPVSVEMKRFHWLSILRTVDPAAVIAATGDEAELAEVFDGPVLVARDVVRPTSGASVVPESDARSDLAHVIYTSGSTAMPKGVACPHRQVLFATMAIARRLRYQLTDRVFVRVPLSFDYGLYQLFLCALVGASVYLSRTRDDAGLARELSDSGATVLPVVPLLGLMIGRLAGRSDTRYRVRLVTSTGGVVTAGLAARLREVFPGAAIVLTECKRVTISEPDMDLRAPGCLGLPLDDTEILIVRDDGTRCAAGEEGHLIVRGPHVMAGYLGGDPDRRFTTTDRPDRGAELRTGDYGHVDEEGNFYFHGRRDDVFKRRSIRVSATEIEAAAIDVPGVVAAVAVPPVREDDVLPGTHACRIGQSAGCAGPGWRRWFAVRITAVPPTSHIEPTDVDLFDPAFYAEGDPHPVWAALRTRDPLHRQVLPDGRAFWSVTRHRDVCRVLGDHHAFTSTRGSLLHQLGHGDAAAGRLLVATDPPHHRTLRRPLQLLLSPSGVAAYTDDVGRAVAQMLRPARESGTWDVAERAAMLPIAVAGAVLGLPEGDWAQLARWTAMAAAPHDDTVRVRSTATTLAVAHHGLFDYFARRIASSGRIASTDGDDLTDEEVIYNCYSLLLGATATIPHAVSGTVLALVEHPDQIADATRTVPRLVEEGLRWTSPANSFLRHAVDDIDIAGGWVRSADAVAVWLGSANRDDSVFTFPYRFEPTREINRHLAFGFGPHYCVGAALARLILRAFFTEFLNTIGSIELAGPVRHLSSLFVAGTTQLPVHTRPR